MQLWMYFVLSQFKWTRESWRGGKAFLLPFSVDHALWKLAISFSLQIITLKQSHWTNPITFRFWGVIQIMYEWVFRIVNEKQFIEEENCKLFNFLMLLNFPLRIFLKAFVGWWCKKSIILWISYVVPSFSCFHLSSPCSQSLWIR